jgi:predicted TIM-barrel fold metal-dependent hydrolase
MIIDAHLHLVPRVRGRIGLGPTRPLPRGRVQVGPSEQRRLLPPFPGLTRFPPEVLLDYMDWAKVDKGVLLQGSFYGECNAAVARALRLWPDRFTGAAFVDPRGPSPLAALRRRAAEGFRLLKFELSSTTGFMGLYPDLRLDEPAFVDLYALAAELGFTITLDLGPVGGPAYQTSAVAALARRHPDTRLVIAHLGQPPLAAPDAAPAARENQILWEEQVLLGRLPNVWFDLASLPYFGLPHDYPFASAQSAVQRAVALIGADRLMWGTDLPGTLAVATYEQLQAWVSRHCDFLTPAERAAVLGGTAAHVYGLTA